MNEIVIHFRFENDCEIQINMNKNYQQLLYSIILNTNKKMASNKHETKLKKWIFSYFIYDTILKKSSTNNYKYEIKKNTTVQWKIRSEDSEISELIEKGINKSKEYVFENNKIIIVNAEINTIKKMEYNNKNKYITIEIETPAIIKSNINDKEVFSKYIKNYQYDKIKNINNNDKININDIKFEIIHHDLKENTGYFLKNNILLWEYGYKGIIVFKITGKYKETFDFINYWQYVGIGRRNNYGFGFNTIINVDSIY